MCDIHVCVDMYLWVYVQRVEVNIVVVVFLNMVALHFSFFVGSFCLFVCFNLVSH